VSQQSISKVQDSIQPTSELSFLKGGELGWYNTALQYLDSPVKSYVYFILAESEGLEPLVKIGLSLDIYRRMNEIKLEVDRGNYDVDWLVTGAETLRILGIVEGTQPLETALHKAFKRKAAGREWFWYDDELSQLIDELLCDYCVCEPCLIADNITDVTNVTLI
jgi:hypothetical protein